MSDNTLSPTLKEALERFGFAKVAARLHGVEEINERAAAQILGTKLAAQMRERQVIRDGLQALAALSTES